MKLLPTILFACCLALCNATQAQRSVAGLFLNAADFSNHRLSEKPVAGERRIIRLNDVVSLPYVTVIRGGHKKRYQKDSLFGYLLADGSAFRFYKRGTYEVVSGSDGLLIYRQTFTTGGKVQQSSANYYFSRNAAAPVGALTRDALAAAYSDDTAFTEQVYESFAGDAELIQYDSRLRVYKLAKAYQQAHAPKH